MMKFLLYICLLSIFPVNLRLTDEEREELYKKYVKNINFENRDEFDEESFLQAKQDSLSYDKDKIRELLKKYNFPESYDFRTAENVKARVKNQGRCGCCWAMASTSALAYRFYKKGIDVDLSPQNELSCYFNSCATGSNLIDPQLTLIINGTLTEQCLPFTSGNGTIEDCPSTCIDPNVEYKKYYAQNAYTVQMNQDNLYDVTLIIIDQLITNGPVMGMIKIYYDLEDIIYNESCINMVYTHDQNAEMGGGHAIVIMGYGFLDNKYYWLIQNSWGEEACVDGFLKIEFGDVGIGSVSFAEPLIKKEESTKVIELSYESRDDRCNMIVNSNSSLDNFKTQLLIIYEHEGEPEEFDFICGVTKVFNSEKKIYCYYENENVNFYKGTFKYKTFRVTGKTNNFVLDKTFTNSEFFFNGNERINPFGQLHYFVKNKISFISNSYRRIYFLFQPVGIDYSLPRISPNEYYEGIFLTHCFATDLKMLNQFIAYCDITDDEFNYFDIWTSPHESYNKMISQSLCGLNYYRDIITCRMDDDIYPIFKIESFDIFNFSEYIIDINLNAKIEKNIANYQGENNTFIVVVFVEFEGKNSTDTMDCEFGSTHNMKDNYTFKCKIYYFDHDKFDNIYLTPYNGILVLNSPFIIIIPDFMKGNKKSNLNQEFLAFNS